MATNFPTSLDSLTNPTSSDSLNSPSHSAQHANANDAIEALQAKVGADSSAVTSSLDYKVAQLEAISHGKILQVVRATDTTLRTTTSTSYVDAGISVTITPTSSTSNILLIWSVHLDLHSGTGNYGAFIITDDLNTAIDGTGDVSHGIVSADRMLLRSNFIAWDSPATTSSKTYKGRMKAGPTSMNVRLQNSTSYGQFFAIEVGA